MSRDDDCTAAEAMPPFTKSTGSVAIHVAREGQVFEQGRRDGLWATRPCLNNSKGRLVFPFILNVVVGWPGSWPI
jgi:hypothetical protein